MRFVLCLLLALSVAPSWAATTQDSLDFLLRSNDFREITVNDGVVIDLRYASSNNFVGQNMYGAFTRLFLHKRAADKLKAAIALLKHEHPGYKFVIYDGLRPRSVQYVLWQKVAGTPQEKYVADPKKGSIHNFGLAIDLSVLDEKGRELDMGTGFDSFTPLAETQLEKEKLASGELTQAQLENRLILRRPMEEAGFKVLPEEWWHFDALPADIVRKQFTAVE
ncbi:MAG TPA: M15 family metallopeptidase [Magnetospirillaceae bacterium]|nr:M15 family metallopeptidase [Magnetospirillaceae bacterium]